MITTIIVALTAFFIYRYYKKRKEREEQQQDILEEMTPSTTPPPIEEIQERQRAIQQEKEERRKKQSEELNKDLTTLFKDAMNKYCFKKDIEYLHGVGAQYHYYDCKSYLQDLVCGTIERDPNNPKDKTAIRFADIDGNTICYVPRDEKKYYYETFGKEFEPRPFFGRLVYDPDGSDKTSMYGITYKTLNDEKKGIMRPLSDFIEDFPSISVDYYRGFAC